MSPRQYSPPDHFRVVVGAVELIPEVNKVPRWQLVPVFQQSLTTNPTRKWRPSMHGRQQLGSHRPKTTSHIFSWAWFRRRNCRSSDGRQRHTHISSGWPKKLTNGSAAWCMRNTFAKTTSKHANTRQNTHVSCGTSRQCAASSWVSFMPNCRITPPPPPPPPRRSETQRLPCATHATPSKYTAAPNINRQRRPAHTGATRQASGVRRPSPRELGRPLPPPMRKR